MDFATVPEALHAAGTVAGAAVTELRGADCGSPAADVAAALPGSAAVGAALDYTEHWWSTFGSWCDRAAQHVGNLTAAAGSYRSAEQANTATLTPGEGTIRGPH